MRRGGLIMVDFFILTKRGGDERPGLVRCFELKVVSAEAGEVGLLDFLEPPEEVFLLDDGDPALEEHGDVFEGTEGAGTEEEVPGEEFFDGFFNFFGISINIGL